MTTPTQPATLDLEELGRLAKACPDDSAQGYCCTCGYSVGECRCAARYALRYGTKKHTVLALLAELRALRAAVQDEPWQKLHDDDTLQVDEGNAYLFAIETIQGWEYFQDAIIWDSETAPHWNDGDSGWDIDDVTHFMPLPAPSRIESK